MTDDLTGETRAVVDLFYEAYVGGNLDGMLALMAEEAVVTFAGHGTFRGKNDIRHYMTWGSTQLPGLRFNVVQKIVEGENAAVTWDETGRTRRGEHWAAIGCDIYRVVDGQIVELTCIGDTEKMTQLLDPYPGHSAS